MEQKRVLLIEDDEDDAFLIRGAFRGGGFGEFTLDCVPRLEDALEALAKESYDIILSDLSLPDSQGLETIRRLKEGAESLPIVVLTGRADAGDFWREALREGAQDYLRKDGLTSEILGRALRYAEVRKALEESVRAHGRAAEEARSELAVANQRLQEFDRRKSEFVRIVAHELRTPLSAIITGMDLLKEATPDGGADADWEEFLEIAVNGAQRLNRIISNLLDISRIEAGQLTTEQKPLDLRTIVETAVAELAPIFEKQGIEIRKRLPDLPVQVTADSDRLVQVLTNLLGNSVRFASSRVEIHLYTWEGRHVIEVKDDGPGIPEASLGDLFKPFTNIKAHAGRNRSGLGLSISRGIMEAHGGRISARNRPIGEGTGAFFEVEIPEAGC